MISVNYLIDKFGTINNILDKSSFRSNVLVKVPTLTKLIDNIFAQVFGKIDNTIYKYFESRLISDPDTDIRFTMCSEKGEKDILVVSPFVIDKASIKDDGGILKNIKNIVDTVECEGRRYVILIPLLDDDYKMKDLALGLTEFFAQAYGGIKDGYYDLDSVKNLLKGLCITRYIMANSEDHQDSEDEYRSTSADFMISISATMIDKIHFDIHSDEYHYQYQNLIYRKSNEYASLILNLMNSARFYSDLYDLVELNGLEAKMVSAGITDATTFTILF